MDVTYSQIFKIGYALLWFAICFLLICKTVLFMCLTDRFYSMGLKTYSDTQGPICRRESITSALLNRLHISSLTDLRVAGKLWLPSSLLAWVLVRLLVPFYQSSTESGFPFNWSDSLHLKREVFKAVSQNVINKLRASGANELNITKARTELGTHKFFSRKTSRVTSLMCFQSGSLIQRPCTKWKINVMRWRIKVYRLYRCYDVYVGVHQLSIPLESLNSHINASNHWPDSISQQYTKYYWARVSKLIDWFLSLFAFIARTTIRLKRLSCEKTLRNKGVGKQLAKLKIKYYCDIIFWTKNHS